MMPRFTRLTDWLVWLESLHPKAIDLGLSRVYQVAQRLSLLEPAGVDSHDYSGALAIADTRVITVAGTNGKGSCIATMERVLVSQGCQVGSYTSPHLHHYCERIRLNGELVDEALVCDAFAAIDEARGDISLTYFEFGTLAALWIFVQQQVPYVLLEVGLGGRLDAVNIVDADIAVITSIAVDHQEWLGSDRELIALEKLGVTRSKSPVVIAESDLTHSMEQFISQHQADVSLIGRDFDIEVDSEGSRWQEGHRILSIPNPVLPVSSVAAALRVLSLLDALPSPAHLLSALALLSLAGRFQQIVYRGCDLVFDVAHNPAAATMLVDRLRQDQRGYATTVAVFAVMADKEVGDIILPFSDIIDRWYLGPLDMERAASVSDVGALLSEYHQHSHSCHTLSEALEQAVLDVERQTAGGERGRIVVFGSFFTVAAVQQTIGLQA